MPTELKSKKYILFAILFFLLISISCSDSLYSAYSGRSKKEARKCSAKVSTANTLYIYRR
ncbi:MAG TPA: hypothetical protein DEO60_05655 [Bacteroidales bacterium]|nr:hypothetical protein [Bacteroidales bacterium]